MPVHQFTNRKTIVFNTKRYCVASRLKPGNFEPQLLHQQLFTHEEFMVHSEKYLLFLGRGTSGFGATTSGLIFILAGWVQEKIRKALPTLVVLTQEQLHAEVHLLGMCALIVQWCVGSPTLSISNSYWNSTVLTLVRTYRHLRFQCRSNCTNTWELNCPFSVSLDQHLYQHELWYSSFSWNWACAVGTLGFNNEKIKVSGVLSVAQEHKLPTWRVKKICLF